MLPFINPSPLYEYLSTRNEHPDEEVPVDVAFVLGSGSIGPIHMAAKLYQLGLTRHIAFTSAGGTFGGNIIFGREETDEYRDVLLAFGVPEQALWFPATSDLRTKNTLAEAQGAIPFVESCIGKVSRMVLCSRAVHQRRAWATFQMQHPDVQYINCPDKEMLTIELLPRLVLEIDRLRTYGAQGDLKLQEIPQEVSDICETLRTHLKL